MRRALALAVLAVAALPSAATAAGRCGDAAQRPWCDTSLDPDRRTALLLGAMTRDEKIGLLAGDEVTGVSGAEGTHTGTLDGVPRLGVPPVFFSDGPVGTRQGRATGMPSPMALAATFDRDLARRHAAVIGDEVAKKGNDVVYAPAVNMLRTPLNGRTFEYFGEDPFLSAQMTVAWTKGVQANGVIGNVKHYAVNNQEGIGIAPPGAPIGVAGPGSRMTVDARVDERTLREIYLPQFEAAVKEGGVGSVMCSYNRINGQYGCENKHLLQEVLKRDWGFKGFVLTDYGAGHNTAASLNNGLDLDIWPTIIYQPLLVQGVIGAGLAPESSIDEHAGRILRTLFAHGFFDRDAFVDDTSRIDQDAHHAEAADIEQDGIVLLRNESDLLPLDPQRVGKVAVIGPEADVLRDGGGSSAINEFRTTTPLAAIRTRLGTDRVTTHDGSDAAAAAAMAKAADVAVVVVGDRMSEGLDKPCMGLNCGQSDGIDRDALIRAVAAAQPRTVVLLQSGGPTLTPWRDDVRALLQAWYPGQNGGTAMARVLFGDAEPSGRLPATFPLREADEPYAGSARKYPGVLERVTYEEGVLIGYRWFDERDLGVAYPFGHGLGYSQFSLSELRLEPGADATVSVLVRNTGSRTGAAVPQLYVGMPEPRDGVVQPPWQLKGFEKVRLRPGDRRRVRFRLDERAFSFWSTAKGGWDVAAGCYRIGVGRSSRDLPLQGTIGRGAECEGALQLPRTSRSCTSRRSFAIRLPRAMRRGRVTVAGRPVRVRRSGGRLRATIDLRGRRSGRVTVRVVGRSKGGKVLRQTRVYRVCARR